MVERKVLVVEDEAIVAMDLRRALEGFGYQVPCIATCGSEAIKMATECRPDIVLMDIRLEGQMDGIEAAHKINGSLDVPVVFLTADSKESTLQRAKKTQPFGFLLKPYRTSELRSAVEIALYKHGMERILHQRKSWLDAILRGMADCVIATDAAGFITFMNPPAESLTGRFLNEVRELTLARVLRLVDENRAPIPLDECASKGFHETASASLIGARGHETPVDFSVTRMQDEQGRQEGMAVVFRDVSIRLKAEQAEASRRAEERLKALIDNLPEGVVCLDLGFHVTLANPPGRSFLRVIADAEVGDVVHDLLGQPLSDIIGAPTDDPHRTTIVESDDHRTFELGVVDLAEDTRGVGGHIIVIRELTRELETRKRLEQSERLASVGQLAAGIAHDFNNMLQAISGLANLIQGDDELPPTVIEKARGISRQGKRGARLIRQILDFSRTSVNERRPLRLELIIKETMRMLEQILSEEIRISTEIEPGEYVVEADPTQVQQVLMNLAVNARDAISGGGELTISLDRVLFADDEPRPFPQMGPGEWLRLAVCDNGSGMPPEVAAQVFEPFFTTKEPGKGTGLGLAQVYGIVKQHEGFIDLETEPGVGTAFLIYLPFSRNEVREEIRAEAVPARVGEGELVLLVEDEAPVRDVIHEMLETLGFEVVTAGSGSEALQVFERFKSDIQLVVSDVVLSGLGGVEVSKKLREMSSDLPVILMSDYPLGDDALSELSAGTTDWISKPFSSEQIAEIIGRVLNPN